MATQTHITPDPSMTPITPDQHSGGIRTSTAIGIGVGLICFLSLILGFYLVSKWERSVRPRTRDDEEAQRTYQRWARRVAGKERARYEQEQEQQQSQPAPPYSPSPPPSPPDRHSLSSFSNFSAASHNASLPTPLLPTHASGGGRGHSGEVAQGHQQ